MMSGLLFVIMYATFFPIVNALLKGLGRWIKRSLYGRRSKTAYKQEEVKDGFARKIYLRLRFVIGEDKRDTNGISNKLIVLGILLVGAIVAFVGGLMNNIMLYVIAMIIQVIGLGIASYKAKDILDKREEVLSRMLSLKSERMGLAGETGKAADVKNEIKVNKWADDYIHPLKIQLYLPTSFDQMRVSNFLLSFNELFSSEGVWVADLTDDDYAGFDFQSGVASLRVTPKLPELANWHERYLFHDAINWSFFPIALGSEAGVPIKNEETGQIEHVLGFAINNEQSKHMKKMGLPVGPDMMASPQGLVSGGTGGGKSLSIDTEIEVYNED